MSVRTLKTRLRASTSDDRHATFERQLSVMKMYSDNAKTYIQLSGAALGLTITFVREILRIPGDQRFADAWLIGMWACFLLAILSGAFYQYLAVKYVQAYLDWEHDAAWESLEPGMIYGVMLVAFYAGAILFTFYAAIMLRR